MAASSKKKLSPYNFSIILRGALPFLKPGTLILFLFLLYALFKPVSNVSVETSITSLTIFFSSNCSTLQLIINFSFHIIHSFFIFVLDFLQTSQHNCCHYITPIPLLTTYIYKKSNRKVYFPHLLYNPYITLITHLLCIRLHKRAVVQKHYSQHIEDRYKLLNCFNYLPDICSSCL